MVATAPEAISDVNVEVSRKAIETQGKVMSVRNR
jgi:hypothetical protein